MFPAFIDVNNDHDDDISKKENSQKHKNTKNEKCQKTQKNAKMPKSQKRQKVPKIPEFDLSKFDTSKKGGYHGNEDFRVKTRKITKILHALYS